MRAVVDRQCFPVDNKKLKNLVDALVKDVLLPGYTRLHAITKIPITTIHDRWKHLERNYEVTAVIQIRRRLERGEEDEPESFIEPVRRRFSEGLS